MSIVYYILYAFTLPEKCPYSEFSGPYFPAFGLNTERYLYSVRIRENADQKNSEYGHFSISVKQGVILLCQTILKTKSRSDWSNLVHFTNAFT